MPPPKSWFTIENSSAVNGAGRVAKIKIHDEIGCWGISAKTFLRALEPFGADDELDFELDTPGGDIREGLTMYDGIQRHPAKIKSTTVIGLAASMGSVVMLATDVRRIAANAQVMVHSVSCGASGTPTEVQRAAEVAKQFEARIQQIYVERTGLPLDQIKEMMNTQSGVWMFGDDAIEKGFATQILSGVQARAFRAEWKNHFRFIPASLFDTAAPVTLPPESTDSMKLTAEQKTRLLALHNQAKRSDAEQKEYDNLLKCEDAASAIAEAALEAKKAGMKTAGLSDTEIEAALKAVNDGASQAAQQKKRAALKAAGLSDKQIDKIFADAKAAADKEAKRAELKAAGLDDKQIEAALKAAAKKSKKKEDEDGEDEDEDESEEDEEKNIAHHVSTALAPLKTELETLRNLVKSGIPNAAGGAQGNGGASKENPGGGGAEDTPARRLVSALATQHEKNFGRN